MPSFGLSGLASGLSAVSGGYDQGRITSDQADTADMDLQQKKDQAKARVAIGSALALLSQQGSGVQPPAPGQQSMPMQQGQPMSLAPPGQQGAQLMPPAATPPMGPVGAPQVPPGMPAPRMMTGTGGAPPGMPNGAPIAPQPGGPPGAPPQMPPGAPQQRPQFGQMQQPQLHQGALDWRQLVAGIKQANPKIEPQVLMEAVNQMVPLMNQHSQMEWRGIALQMREDQLRQRQFEFDQRERDRQEAETGRNRRADQSEAGKNQRFQQREVRLEEALDFRRNNEMQRLALAKQTAAERVYASNGRLGLAEWRASLDAWKAKARAQIDAYSLNNALDDDQRKKLYDEAEQQYRLELSSMQESVRGPQQGTPGGQQQAPALSPAGKTQDQVGAPPAQAPAAQAPAAQAPAAQAPAAQAPAARPPLPPPDQRPDGFETETGQGKFKWDKKSQGWQKVSDLNMDTPQQLRQSSQIRTHIEGQPDTKMYDNRTSDASGGKGKGTQVAQYKGGPIVTQRKSLQREINQLTFAMRNNPGMSGPAQAALEDKIASLKEQLSFLPMSPDMAQ